MSGLEAMNNVVHQMLHYFFAFFELLLSELSSYDSFLPIFKLHKWRSYAIYINLNEKRTYASFHQFRIQDLENEMSYASYITVSISKLKPSV